MISASKASSSCGSISGRMLGHRSILRTRRRTRPARRAGALVGACCRQSSLGPEVRYDINAEDEAGRVGAFLRYEWFGGEISAAGGAAGTISRDGKVCKKHLGIAPKAVFEREIKALL